MYFQTLLDRLRIVYEGTDFMNPFYENQQKSLSFYLIKPDLTMKVQNQSQHRTFC